MGKETCEQALKVKVAQFHSLLPHGLQSPWNSPGQNTGMGSLSLLQGIFPIQGSNPGLLHCRQILYQLSPKGAQEYWSRQPILSPVDLPDPGFEPGSPALAVDSLLPGGSDGKSVCLQCGRPGFDPWMGRILWRRKWQPTPVLLPGQYHGLRSLQSMGLQIVGHN